MYEGGGTCCEVKISHVYCGQAFKVILVYTSIQLFPSNKADINSGQLNCNGETYHYTCDDSRFFV